MYSRYRMGDRHSYVVWTLIKLCNDGHFEGIPSYSTMARSEVIQKHRNIFYTAPTAIAER